MTGAAGATYLVIFRLVQGVGGAFLLANSAAILTDAFPANQRGMALGINNIVGVSGIVHRPGARRSAGPDQLAPGVPHLRPGRAVRDRLGLHEAARTEPPAEGREGRLARQHHVRARTDPDHGLDHVRDPSLRTPRDGLGQPAGAGSRRRRGAIADRLRDHRDAHRGADVPAAAAADPRIQRRHALNISGVRITWRPDVHVDHLAAGDLATSARRRLHADPATRRHLHAAVDGRDAHLGPAVRDPLRPLRLAPVRDRRDDRHRDRVRLPLAAADQLLLPGVRARAAVDGLLDGHVRLTEPRGGDEQPAARRTAAPAAR